MIFQLVFDRHYELIAKESLHQYSKCQHFYTTATVKFLFFYPIDLKLITMAISFKYLWKII